LFKKFECDYCGKEYEVTDEDPALKLEALWAKFLVPNMNSELHEAVRRIICKGGDFCSFNCLGRHILGELASNEIVSGLNAEALRAILSAIDL
jgi:hypothetical protein